MARLLMIALPATLTAETAVVDRPEEEAEHAGHHHGHAQLEGVLGVRACDLPEAMHVRCESGQAVKCEAPYSA